MITLNRDRYREMVTLIREMKLRGNLRQLMTEHYIEELPEADGTVPFSYDDARNFVEFFSKAGVDIPRFEGWETDTDYQGLASIWKS